MVFEENSDNHTGYEVFITFFHVKMLINIFLKTMQDEIEGAVNGASSHSLTIRGRNEFLIGDVQLAGMTSE